MGEDGWESDYSVIEETPPTKRAAVAEENRAGWPPDLGALIRPPWELADADLREPALRIAIDSVKVHRVRRVQFETEEFAVRRHRWEKREPDF